ncbi:MAG: hypothetical protein FWB91_11690 [Defluviitaleaceae bacterium]|nr:hypothetical protein [Defluviitaleaceae bacterium]
MSRGNDPRRPRGKNVQHERAHHAVRRDYYDAPRRDRENRDSYRDARPSHRRPRDTYRKPYYEDEDTRIAVSRSRGKMSFSASVVAALFFGFVLVYMAFRAYGFFQPSVVTEVVRMGNMDMQASIPAMIIRHEQPFYSDRAGHVVPLVGDFERVREGDIVFSIRDIDAVDRNIQNLALVEEQIIGLHEMRDDPAIAQINSNLLTVMDRNIHVFSQPGLHEVYALLDRLNQATNNRNQIKIGQTSGARADLAHEHALLTQHRDATVYNIYSGRSGIMSPFLDDFVGEFRPDNMRELSREQINMTVDHTTIVPVREVEEGDRVFKIVGNTWYVVSFMPAEMVSGFEVGQERTLYLENMNSGRFEAVPMRIAYIGHDHHHRYRRIVFRSNRYVIRFLNQRNVNIRTTYNVQSGLKIPVSAIAQRRFLRIPLTHLNQGGDYYVMHFGDEGLRRVIVNVYNMSATHAYIPFDYASTLRMGDILVPVDISEGDHEILTEGHISTIRGVFRTNLDFADFRQIHFDGDMENYSHILLDPTLNPNIRQFDTIVSDAAVVRQGQVIS